MIFNYLGITILVHLSLIAAIGSKHLERIPNENCKFLVGGHMYDLSELSNEQQWKYSEVFKTDRGSRKHYFISICHSLDNLKNCENSNMCFTNIDTRNSSSISYISGGKSNSKDYVPEYLDEGHLSFNFINGAPCKIKKGILLRNYSTRLFLQCPLKNEEESYGPILMSSSPWTCTFIFAWITKAACPKKHNINQKLCTVTTSDNLSINLNSLNSPTFYTLRKNNLSFELNICGPIVNGSCQGNNTSICDVSNENNLLLLAHLNNEKIEWNNEKRNIEIAYKEKNSSANIKLICDQKMTKPKVIFKDKGLSNGTSQYQFEIKTGLACLSMKTKCVLHNSNNGVIDLRPLRKTESNWKVFVPKNIEKNFPRQLYVLNICGPLNNAENYGCPPGLIGACKPSFTNGAGLNLGYITSNPTISEDGSISILYTGGDPCKKNVQSSSTKIILYCSKKQHLPILVTITSSCLHVFEWHTPAACPMQEIIGNSCKVTDPLHGEVFDLNPLRNKSSDYLIKSDSETFLLNVCGPLLSKCNGQNSSICTLGDRKSGGRSPGTLIFDDGTLIMEFYDGSSCNGGTWSTKILILCNHDDRETAPEHFQTNNETCTHVFIWHTFHACPSFTTVDCFIQDKNNLYDLSSLSDPMDNWAFESTKNGVSRKYVFNICRSIVHSKEYRCPYKAGACVLNSGNNGGALSLGNVVSSPYIKNGTIMIHYTGGANCTDLKRHETLIVFECVPWTYNSVPVLMKEENCQTIIKIPTNHACPKKLLPEIVKTTGNCSVVNPFTNYVYDFSSLRSSKPVKISYGENSTIFLNVCGNLDAGPCSLTDSGSCWLERSKNETKIKNMGLANSDLKFSRWNTFLEYKNGDSCHTKLHGIVERKTKISFVCAEVRDMYGPVVIDYDENSCTLYVNWHTDLACEREIKCFGKSHKGKAFNLAPFAKYFGNYEIKDPYNSTITYYINICKPLNPMKGIRCYPGSAACMVIDEIGSNKKVSSLGHALVDPVVISNDDIVLMYSHGSSCPLEGLSSSSLTSRITFVCNRTIGVGAPMFIKRTHDCQIQFEWHTSVVCQHEIENDTHLSNQCQIYLEKAKANTNLKPLYRNGGYIVHHGKKTFKVNVCGPVCNNSGVCTEDGTSYGLLANVQLQWESDMLKLVYYTGDPCSSALTFKRSSMIYFECDMQAGFGVPVAEPWNDEESCTMVFSWRTNVTCLEAIYKPQPITVLPSPSTTMNDTTTPSTTEPIPEALNSSDLTFSVMIAFSIASLALVASAVLFFRSFQGRRLTTRAKGFFIRKGDEVFIMDDQHLQAV